jgi:NAD(P)H-nitrite reductase large subunit
MLKLGEKGAILQGDGQTYAVAPDIPCGLITPELLRRLADVAERYHAQAVKITGATRVALIGLKEEDLDRVWEDLKLGKIYEASICHHHHLRSDAGQLQRASGL